MKFACESFGFKIVNRHDFFRLPLIIVGFNVEADNLAAGRALLDRARRFEGSYILYDPTGDGEGFLLVGNNANQLDAQFMEHHDLTLEGNEND